MNKSQYRAVDNYEENKTCSCGRPSNHIPLGVCWVCYTQRFGTTRAIITGDDRKAELERLGLWDECRVKRIDKALRWNAENNPRLKRMALAAIDRRRKAADEGVG
jgi:hypothetical protein